MKAAHARGLKITGHLCSVTFREAADLGIDNLEHGLGTDTEFYKDKQPDACPSLSQPGSHSEEPAIDGPEIQSTIQYLIQHHVAITSTLPVGEAGVPTVLRCSSAFWTLFRSFAYRLSDGARAIE